MSSKEIRISPELFDRKKNKTLKKPTGKQLKKELLHRLSQGSDLIQELDALTKEPETAIWISTAVNVAAKIPTINAKTDCKLKVPVPNNFKHPTKKIPWQR